MCVPEASWETRTDQYQQEVVVVKLNRQLGGFREVGLVNMHWHHETAKKLGNDDRLEALERLKQLTPARFVMGDANM